MLRGRSPWGLGGAVYLLVRSFVRVSFVDMRSSMPLTGGWGMLSNTAYPRKYNSNTLKDRNNRTKRLALLGRCPSR
jgi:hypothetical protein